MLRKGCSLEIWEAGSWENVEKGIRLGCTEHLGARWSHYTNKKGARSGLDLMCTNCMQCAYCTSKFQECWQPMTHHPKRDKWNKILKNNLTKDRDFLKHQPSMLGKINPSQVYEVEPVQLRNRGKTLDYKELTQEEVFHGEKLSSSEESKRLRELNNVLREPRSKNLKRKLPANGKDLDGKQVWTQARWYCRQALEVMAPGLGEEMYNKIIEKESRIRNKVVTESWESMLTETAKIYLLTPDEDCRSVMFAQLCGWLSRPKLNDLLEMVYNAGVKSIHTSHVHIGTKRYEKGQILHAYLTNDGVLPGRKYPSRLKTDDALDVLRWIKDMCPLGWKPGRIKTVIEGGVQYKFNVLQRAGKASLLTKRYAVHKKQKREKFEDPNTWIPGRGTLLAFLKLVTEEVRSKACISYYYIRLVDTFQLYKRLVSDMEKLYTDAVGMCGAKKSTSTELQNKLEELKVREKDFKLKRDELQSLLNWAKYELRGHLKVDHSDCRDCGLHCIQHALGGCDDTLPHSADCPECMKFIRCGHDLRLWLRKWHTDMCRAFEKELDQWKMRGSVFSAENDKESNEECEKTQNEPTGYFPKHLHLLRFYVPSLVNSVSSGNLEPTPTPVKGHWSCAHYFG